MCCVHFSLLVYPGIPPVIPNIYRMLQEAGMPVYTLAEIARHLEGELHGAPEIPIRDTAEIERAEAGHITFLANPKYRPRLKTTRASAIIIDDRAGVTPEIPYIKVADAYYGFMQTVVLFHPPAKLLEEGAHPTAVIHETARIGKHTAIGANVYIGEGVEVGEGTQIFPNCVVLNNSRIGKNCVLYPGVTVRENTLIGDRVIIHNGAVIGSDGFGFAFHQGRYHKIPQVGRVVIEDDVEIGANVTIDRATLGDTVIKTGVKLDNLIHIAHNVVVGEHTVMAAQTGISGSTRIGRNVMIAGQVGLVGHIEIGDGAKIGAQSGVSKSVPPGETVFGYPARPIMKTHRIEAALNQLPELIKRVRTLEKQLRSLLENRDQNQ
ncbi:MAG: UDP-3-O-(3-hydroxymyristoyl)glucosamine N-acyltransferase [Calditrichaeota bacterium]|nr:MAG: UDP-3-O-(3-hydroxymyristoyl)glucosamine N-acyltransferase [Calditrichota bacterium]